MATKRNPLISLKNPLKSLTDQQIILQVTGEISSEGRGILKDKAEEIAMIELGEKIRKELNNTR